MTNYLHINHNDMRNQNLALILKHLHQNGPISRVELSTQLGMNKASISTIIRDLIKRGIVVELGSQKRDDVGAPPIQLIINPDAGRVISVEVCNSSVRAIISDLNLKFLWGSEKKFYNDNLDDRLRTIKDVILESCKIARKSKIPIIGLSLGIPGMVDINKNITLFSAELGWENIDLNFLMVENADIPFYTGNEAHMSALGEMYFGSTQKSRSSIFISWGKEVRGGVIVNQNVMPGGLGLAGEIGHLIVDSDGDLCSCGKKGCWNTFVNFDALCKCLKNEYINEPSQTRNKFYPNFPNIELDEIVFAALNVDATTMRALKLIGQRFGIGISNLINLTNPEFIIIGGQLAALFEFMRQEVMNTIDQYSFPWQRESCRVQISDLGKDSCLIGGIATIIWNILNDPQGAIR